jgi:spore coat protein CotH
MSVRANSVGVLATLVLAAACSSGGDDTDAATTETALFDGLKVHAIEVTFDQDDYEAMVETYGDSGEKEWIEATVTIDGSTYDQVGLRLKGNSSLMGLGGGIGGRQPVGGDDPTTESTTSTTESTTSTDEPAGQTTDTTAGDASAGGDGGGFGPGGSASADEPESLPWLIRLDEFVEGQNHQGYEDIVVRSNGSETSLNEAVALDLLEAAGLASQKAMSTSATRCYAWPSSTPTTTPGRRAPSTPREGCTRRRAPATGPTAATTPPSTRRCSTRRVGVM